VFGPDAATWDLFDRWIDQVDDAGDGSGFDF